MPLYECLHIPKACEVRNTIFKKLFYDNADLGSVDKALFTDNISKITWVYSIKTENINIKAYKDDIRDYSEIEVLEVSLSKNTKIKRIAEIIMRSIPYPMLLVFKFESKIQLWAAHQRTNQNDNTKNTIEEFVNTDWLSEEDVLFDALDIKQMRFIDFYTLYSDFVDKISIYNVKDIIGDNTKVTGPQARNLISEITELDNQITALKAKSKKETQFNKRIDMNIEIKKLCEQKKAIFERQGI